jgi:hypothetical protein
MFPNKNHNRKYWCKAQFPWSNSLIAKFFCYLFLRYFI